MPEDDPAGAASATDPVCFVLDDRDHRKSFFHGYCFKGADYIYGERGAEAFAEHYGEPVPPGEDGAYVAMRKIGTKTIFWSDFSGYKKLFYFHVGGRWAVSNSVHLLTKRMRAMGLRPTADPMILKCGLGERTLMRQLFSYRTHVREIGMVPLGHFLEISKGGAGVYPSLRPTADHTYREALQHCVTLWVSRLETLIVTSQMEIVSDLTGGQDSRVIFGLLEKATARLGTAAKTEVSYRSGKGASNAADLRVAQALADERDITLNPSNLPKTPSTSERWRVENWRDTCVGVYQPIYLSSWLPRPRTVSFSGAGGGLHRPFYANQNTGQNAYALTRNMAELLNSSRRRKDFTRLLNGVFAEISVYPENGSGDPLVRHFKHFRNRIHGGRVPQIDVNFSPLVSSSMEAASGMLSGADFERAQFHFDLMHATDPTLLREGFDENYKNPTAAVFENLTKIELAAEPSPGRVFLSDDDIVEVPNTTDDPLNRFDHLQSIFDEACDDKRVRRFWGADVLAQCFEALAEAKKRGGFRHAKDGCPVTAVIASAQVADTLPRR